MRKFFLISIFVLTAFLFEMLIFSNLPKWLKPNFIILIVVFCNFYFGIRQSLYAAALGGILKDSFSLHVFGMNVFSLMIAAVATIYYKQHFYRRGSKIHRYIMVFVITTLNFVLQFLILFMSGTKDFSGVMTEVYLPEVFMTVILTHQSFQLLKKCASKLSV